MNLLAERRLSDAESIRCPRYVALVSDGKETCPGDPCAVAKALAAADAKLVIHTIGFNVDAAARYASLMGGLIQDRSPVGSGAPGGPER